MTLKVSGRERVGDAQGIRTEDAEGIRAWSVGGDAEGVKGGGAGTESAWRVTHVGEERGWYRACRESYTWRRRKGEPIVVPLHFCVVILPTAGSTMPAPGRRRHSFLLTE